MTGPTTTPAGRPGTASRWPIILTSYVAAVLSFAASLPYALPRPLDAIANSAARVPVEWASVLAWFGLTAWAFTHWGKRAWPTLLGAPFALVLPISFMVIVAQCLMGKCLWWPG